MQDKEQWHRKLPLPMSYQPISKTLIDRHNKAKKEETEFL